MFERPYYRLGSDGRTPIPVPDVLLWAEWFEHADRILMQTEVPGGIVSTVFLGIDHAFGHGPPLLWETMAFMDGNDVTQARYSTYDEAARGHGEIVKSFTR